MTPSDDLSPPRRPIFFPVVIATVFLTIIGLTAGFVLGERRNNNAGSATQNPAPTSDSAGPWPGESASVPSKRCPQEAVEKAAQIGIPVELWQVMKIVTDIGTTVWICTDDAGRLYYQSKTGGPDARLEQDRNGLFLDQVRSVGPYEYEVDDHKGNHFVITRARLEIDFIDKKVADQSNEVVSGE